MKKITLTADQKEALISRHKKCRDKRECDRIKADDGSKNMALFRRTLLNLITAHPLKDSVAGKMMRAGWDSKFRAEILFGQKTTKV